jgi:hypothetical protein
MGEVREEKHNNAFYVIVSAYRAYYFHKIIVYCAACKVDGIRKRRDLPDGW